MSEIITPWNAEELRVLRIVLESGGHPVPLRKALRRAVATIDARTAERDRLRELLTEWIEGDDCRNGIVGERCGTCLWCETHALVSADGGEWND